MKKAWRRRLVAVFLALACVTAGCSTTGKQEKNEENSVVEDLDTVGENMAEAEGDTGKELSEKPVKIGAIYALSGNNAVIGTNILRGLDFAAEMIIFPLPLPLPRSRMGDIKQSGLLSMRRKRSSIRHGTAGDLQLNFF